MGSFSKQFNSKKSSCFKKEEGTKPVKDEIKETVDDEGNRVITGKPKRFKFGKGKGEVKTTYETTFVGDSDKIKETKITRYDRQGKEIKTKTLPGT